MHSFGVSHCWYFVFAFMILDTLSLCTLTHAFLYPYLRESTEHIFRNAVVIECNTPASDSSWANREKSNHVDHWIYEGIHWVCIWYMCLPCLLTLLWIKKTSAKWLNCNSKIVIDPHTTTYIHNFIYARFPSIDLLQASWDKAKKPTLESSWTVILSITD